METSNTVKIHIFVLDDEQAVCEAIKETLEEANYKASCFGSPVECLARLRSEKCDLLITDLKMPDKDGFEVLAEVRHRNPSIPVLMITGYSDISTALKAKRAGASDFLEKPLSKKDILWKIKSILKQKRFILSEIRHSFKPIDMAVEAKES